MKAFKKAIENVKPALEVKSRARRRLDLPGPGRGAAQPPDVARDPLAHRVLARRAARRRCARSSPPSCSTPRTCGAAP